MDDKDMNSNPKFGGWLHAPKLLDVPANKVDNRPFFLLVLVDFAVGLPVFFRLF